MDKDHQQKELREKKIAFDEIREKFNNWRFNMYLCLFLYIIFFIIIQSVNTFLIKKKAPKWLSSSQTSQTLVVFIAAVILGICFIGDSIVTSYLKTPLQRLALKIDISPIEDKKKSHLMRVTQETNELFKETLKKFGILFIPSLIYSIIDTKQIKVFDKAGNLLKVEVETNTRSERLMFNICYLIPVVFATWRIVQFNRDLRQIEQKILNEQKKNHGS